MTIGVTVPLHSTSLEDDTAASWLIKPAGSYDLVALDPQGVKRCAKKIVSLAADPTWTIEDFNSASFTTAVPANFVHVGFTRGISCTQAIAIYY